MPRRIAFVAIAAVVIAARLLHSSVLWADDNLPLAAAMQVAMGKTLYRDVWFDKPPLVAWIDLLWGARDGVWLRLAGAIYVLAVAAMAWKFARAKWTEREGLLAAFFAAFFLTFDLPSAVIPLASDMLLILPHFAAIYFAWRARPFWSGVAAGIGLLCSSKAIFVLAACALWQWRALPMLLAGFALPNAIAHRMDGRSRLGSRVIIGKSGNGDRFMPPTRSSKIRGSEGVKRTADWLGFHAALAMGAILSLWRERKWRIAAWIGIAFIGVVLGLRFFPRYYFLLLPPMTIAGGARMGVLRNHGALNGLVLRCSFFSPCLWSDSLHSTLSSRAGKRGAISIWIATAAPPRRSCAHSRDPATHCSCGDSAPIFSSIRAFPQARDFSKASRFRACSPTVICSRARPSRRISSRRIARNCSLPAHLGRRWAGRFTTRALALDRQPYLAAWLRTIPARSRAPAFRFSIGCDKLKRYLMTLSRVRLSLFVGAWFCSRRAHRTPQRSLTIAVNAGVEGTALKAAAQEWGAARGMHIEVVELPYANLFEKEQLDLTSRTGAYDVIMLDDPWFPRLAEGGDLAPLPREPDADFLASLPRRVPESVPDRHVFRAALCREFAVVFLSPGPVREI